MPWFIKNRKLKDYQNWTSNERDRATKGSKLLNFYVESATKYTHRRDKEMKNSRTWHTSQNTPTTWCNREMGRAFSATNGGEPLAAKGTVGLSIVSDG